MAYLAHNLDLLRAEVNHRWPVRDHGADGWIGDAAHQASVSDHNPDRRGCVHAVDFDKDGLDPLVIVRQAIKHITTSYVIWNRTIWERDRNFAPHAYNGLSPHTDHVHVSGLYGVSFENNNAAWGITPVAVPTPPAPPAPKPDGTHNPGTRELFWMPAGSELRGPDVAYVQRWIGKTRAGSADGVFGGKTRGGVMWYQGQRGLTPDGIVGPKTWKQMNVAWRG